MSPFVLPKAARAEVQFRNTVFGTHRRIPFSISDQGWEFCFDSDIPTFSAPVVVTLSVGNEPVQLELSNLDAFPVVSQMLAGVALDQLPSELQLISLEAAFEPLLNTLQQVSGQRLRIDHVGRATAPLAHAVTFVLSFSGQQIIGRATMSATTRDTLQKLVSTVAPTSVSNPIEVPCLCELEWGRATVTLAELQSLQVHDVLLDDHSSIADPDQLRLICPQGTAYPAKLADRKLVVCGPAEPVAAQPRAASDPISNRTDLPVVCTFSLGRIELTPGELSAIRPDQPLPVSITDDQPLQVFVGKQLVFTGEAVEIGNRLGVRILRTHS